MIKWDEVGESIFESLGYFFNVKYYFYIFKVLIVFKLFIGGEYNCFVKL